MIRRVVTYSALAAGALGTGLSLHANDYDVNSLGIVRLGRAAATVYDIGITYKTELFYREWDKTTDEYKSEKSRVHKIAASKLLDLICANKGVYIKVGQHIGALDYLLPAEFVQTMKVLHNDAPSNPIEDLYKVIKQDLKKNPDEIFESFEREPLGTASLAQVHKAKLKTGEIVAVKVQHPYVRGNSLVDMKTMEYLVKLMSFVFPEFKIQWLVDESKKNLPIELDFLNEGRNAEKIAKIFKNYKWLKIPKIYWEHSTKRVLVMEYLDGGHVTDLNYIKENKIDTHEVSNKIGRLYSDMIFIHGFVHSDPHPGNILVKKDPATSKTDIVLLDHGLYANLTDKFRYEYSKLWLSILRVDRNAMRLHATNLGIQDNLYGLLACMVTGRSWDSILSGVDKTKYTSAEKDIVQNNSKVVLPRIADVLEQVNRQMLLILKTNDLIRGIETTLGTHNRMTAFWVMSKCCVRSVYDEEKKKRPARLSKISSTLRENWEIFKLNIYYLYLSIVNLTGLSALKR
ncbi:unnamed protein product [Hermetia illucens]|uniref:Protein kinase domain-containing protein n=1 Tax=Hermetia illucens TaxID=343691 RepID=A0A7R8UZW6_HERIL|nr:aarF domain-containing kinase 1 [Hermetia illucens]CAD7089546.1 unnamed protein product [Hermetia illucens]